MKIPVIQGLIRRRILVNYRVEPEVVRALLPANFRPKLAAGYCIAGICLIRLEEVRPKGLPRVAGISSENCAHRIAVEWDDPEGAKEGVFIPRRDTDSCIHALAGGRIFPGVHHRAMFSVRDWEGAIALQVVPKGSNEPLVDLRASEANSLPEGSVFTSLKESSVFFEAGCVGYSTRPGSCRMDGLLLKTNKWEVTPLEMHSIRSTFFEDPGIFPEGSIEYDHALLMRNIPHEWHSEPEMVARSPERRSVSCP